jgi:hypothetical protein
LSVTNQKYVNKISLHFGKKWQQNTVKFVNRKRRRRRRRRRRIRRRRMEEQ